MSKKKFISLNLRLTIVVLATIVLAISLYGVSDWLENILIEKFYKSDAAIEKNVGKAYSGLEEYIANNNVKGTDTEKLQKWVKKNDYTYLTVSDDTNTVFDGGWSYSPTTDNKTKSDKKLTTNNQIKQQTTTLDENFKTNFKNRIVKFADKKYYVFIDVYKEEHFSKIMLFVKIFICGLAIFGSLLIYNSRVLKRMIRLSKEVQEVIDGNLEAEVNPMSNDEIGRLAVNVDNMRNSIVERLQSEKAAWDANTQLITAMSHDIRTPLTSLIGYLDIIESHKYNSEEEMLKYIVSSREKAFQLKDLSDKLFQYFLVFGSHKEKELEVYNAGILLQQLISEHAAELINYGYQIDFEYSVPEIDIKADVSGLKRLFDNVSSNILKYADKTYHVRISAVQELSEIIIRIINRSRPDSRDVESNKIGLKTCERICRNMGGRFSYKDEGSLFTVKINLPVFEGMPEGEIKADEAESQDSAETDMTEKHQ